MPLIFQYGSNTNTGRLKERLGEIEDLGRAQTISEYDIAFHVWSQSNGCAASDLVVALGTGRHAWGVLYRLSEAQMERLRKIEGRFYQETPITVRDKNGNEITDPVMTFLVREKERRLGLWTSADYVRHIVTGLRSHDIEKVDAAYIQHIIDIALDTNQKAAERATDESRLIESLRMT